MVYTNNNLKNKNQKKDTKEKEIPVYPFSVDISSFPERKYLIGIYKIARFSYISLFLSIILCLFIIIRSFDLSVLPQFIYWNEIENKFAFQQTKKEAKPSENIKRISSNVYLNEYFIKTYIEKRFSISSIYADNYKNWCNCSSSDFTSKVGLFNLDEDCYLCRFSSSNVYNTFLNNEKAGFEKLFSNSVTRNVKILNMQNIYNYESSSDVSFIDQLLNKKNIINIRSYYKIDFIIETISKNNIQKEALIAYIEIIGPKNSPEKRGVVNASYMFNPNSNLVISNYLKGGKNDI